MPIRITDHNTGQVYLASEQGQPVHQPDLQSVTFVDEVGTPHTVHAHKDAHDGDPEKIVQAYYAGTLTPDPPAPADPDHDDEHQEGGGY